MQVKKDDQVEVLTGNDAGKKGKVLIVNHGAGKVVVEGINKVYKHVQRSQKNPQGGRLSKEMPIQISNVAVVCPHCNKPCRTGARILDDGSKERICKKCKKPVGALLSPARTRRAKKVS
ncbi:MAG: 50S ribosomal protein L24 [Pirellulaceae bacterium]|nr:50S ribosomal protein L24 [Pirellulaceae bacterium]